MTDYSMKRTPEASNIPAINNLTTDTPSRYSFYSKCLMLILIACSLFLGSSSLLPAPNTSNWVAIAR
jgi:hypothetical protein